MMDTLVIADAVPDNGMHPTRIQRFSHPQRPQRAGDAWR